MATYAQANPRPMAPGENPRDYNVYLSSIGLPGGVPGMALPVPAPTAAPTPTAAPAPTAAPTTSAAPLTIGNLPYTPGEKISAVPMMEDWQLGLGKQTADFLSGNVGGYTPGQLYTGQRTAGMTSPEQTGMGILEQTLQQTAPNATFQAGKDELGRVLSGEYADPNTSPYIQAMSDIANRKLQEQIDTSRRAAGARGAYYGTKSMEEETGLRENTLQNLNAIIGEFINKERDRTTAAIPQAKDFANYEQLQFPLTQVGASQQYGALPRAVEQADFESKYQDWLRGRGEMTDMTGQAMDMFKAAPTYGLKDITMPNTLDMSQITPEQIARMFSGGGGVSGFGGGGSSGGSSSGGGSSTYYGSGTGTAGTGQATRTAGNTPGGYNLGDLGLGFGSPPSTTPPTPTPENPTPPPAPTPETKGEYVPYEMATNDPFYQGIRWFSKDGKIYGTQFGSETPKASASLHTLEEWQQKKRWEEMLQQQHSAAYSGKEPQVNAPWLNQFELDVYNKLKAQYDEKFGSW